MWMWFYFIFIVRTLLRCFAKTWNSMLVLYSQCTHTHTHSRKSYNIYTSLAHYHRRKIANVFYRVFVVVVVVDVCCRLVFCIVVFCLFISFTLISFRCRCSSNNTEWVKLNCSMYLYAAMRDLLTQLKRFGRVYSDFVHVGMCVCNIYVAVRSVC